MPEEQKSPEEQRRSAQRGSTQEERRAAQRSKEEETKTYVVKEGQTWGSNPKLQAGDTVELTEAEAAGFEDKLEPADAPKPETPEGTTPPPSSNPSVPRRAS